MVVDPADDAPQITLTCTALALFVALEADVPGRFSDCGFALLPGQPRCITFTPEGPGPTPLFTLRDLHSATYGAANPPNFPTETP